MLENNLEIFLKFKSILNYVNHIIFKGKNRANTEYG